MIDHRNLANAIRALSMDAVQQAKSGHPGAPMGMADIATVLWRGHLRHNPANPHWPDRDRFVLSNGHGSMLLYALLYLSGYDLPLDELRNFRQLGSMTPGHPEFGHTPGVETTTGPLGQGLANAVGMALAEQQLARTFNRTGHTLVDHRTWVFAGDGCLMEGVSHEVCSLAGTHRLGKLTVFYDANGISIDGQVDGWFTDDTSQRFAAYGWQVIGPIDGHDPAAIEAAVEQAKADHERPTLIICTTVIGYGSPHKAGTAGVHGAPLGEEEVAATREQLGWSHPPFEIPPDLLRAWDARTRGAREETEWRGGFAAYRDAHPELADEFERRMAGRLPRRFADLADRYIAEQQAAGVKAATRQASQMALEAYAPALPELLGGSADLTGSNNTNWSGSRAITASESGNYLYYGVREFGMTAIANGMALHGGFIPYTGTFLVFMEYARNAVRLAALMQQRSIFVYTHDSIGLGEDGPTHQPVEQLANLRATPNLSTWRPADAVETAVAWKFAIANQAGPTALVLSRQGLPAQARTAQQLADIERGGYILHEPERTPDAVLIATGSELQLAMDAASELATQGVALRVVSMPSLDRFLAQPADYREQVLPLDLRVRVSIEAAHPEPWFRLVGLDGVAIGMEQFGASAPAAALMQHFGFTVQAVVDAVQRQLSH